jgi:NitT/TauT family transport system substrate-binding protein
VSTRRAVLIGVSAVLAAHASARAQSLVPLRIGCVLGESYANAFFAQEQGFFRRAGLDVRIESFASGGTITAAVTGGALDIGAGSSTSAANAFVRGLPIRLVAPGGVYTTDSPTTMLAVTPSSQLRTAKALTGKTIGITTLRDLTQVSVMSWIDKNGGESASIQFAEFPPSSMAPNLVSGRADAVFIGEPYMTQAKDQIRIIGSPYDAVAKRFLIIGWSATKDWLDRNTDAAKRFVAALREANLWAARNVKDTLPILSKYTKIPVEVMASMHHVAWVPSLDPALIQPVIDASFQYKTLTRAFPAAELIYPGLE